MDDDLEVDDALEEHIRSVNTVGPDDKIIVHVEGTSTTREQMKAIADTFTRVFGEGRSVILVGDTIHINVVKGK